MQCICDASILQSWFIEKDFKKTDNFQHSVVLLLFLFTVYNTSFAGEMGLENMEMGHGCVWPLGIMKLLCH